MAYDSDVKAKPQRTGGRSSRLGGHGSVAVIYSFRCSDYNSMSYNHLKRLRFFRDSKDGLKNECCFHAVWYDVDMEVYHG